MKIKVLDEKPTTMTTLFSETNPTMVNLLRRLVLGEVPVMAIDRVTVYENSSVMFDEYIAHRLGLIPLKTDLKTYKRPQACCGGNCSSCSVEMSIDESGPKTVYSSDIKTSDPKVKPVTGKIPIVRLAGGQRLRLEARAVLGSGEDHVKWQAGLAAYKYVSDIKVSKECDNCGDCIKVCPVKILKKGKKTVEVTNALPCTACEKCVETCPKKAISIEPDATRFVFRTETQGQMPARKTLVTAVDILASKGDNMQKLLKEVEL